MTLEDIRKHARPLVWEKDEQDNSLIPINCIDTSAFIFPNESGTWYSYADDQNYPTKEEAMQSIKEYHLIELAKLFHLEEATEQTTIMTREELLKNLLPIEWNEVIGSFRPAYQADQFIGGYAFISQSATKWITSFDEVEYSSLSDAMQAADEYRKSKILSHFNLDDR
jgi:hypothetical protein|nr:MAG TPA: hypothetical protein [Caudoviricetes sp.]